ncbi:hypothetical protein [Streptomyces catenulae]|uniref:Uncharacterized protein n=1 Tax=Streptomyces catenulae TaxID=66875 RepID=A0ABV2Z660_9ACTN|nr:hypothetical protein [Streptomyces catenulae]
MTDRAPHPHPSGPSVPGPAPAADDTAAHHTSTSERGSFISAGCTCGWRGAARRARSQARTDAERHLTAAARPE